MINKIHQGDILGILGTMQDNSVDLVITDPPFNDGIDYGISKDNRLDYWEWVDKWISEYKRISNNRMAILLRKDKLTKYIEILGLNNTELILIDTGNNWFGLIVMGYLFHKTIFWNHQNEKNFLTDKIQYNNPGLTSLKLMQRIISNYSKPDDLILDGFMGCGTTAVACRILKRNFIGIELNPDYIEIGNRRLEGTNHGN